MEHRCSVPDLLQVSLDLKLYSLDYVRCYSMIIPWKLIIWLESVYIVDSRVTVVFLARNCIHLLSDLLSSKAMAVKDKRPCSVSGGCWLSIIKEQMCPSCILSCWFLTKQSETVKLRIELHRSV